MSSGSIVRAGGHGSEVSPQPGKTPTPFRSIRLLDQLRDRIRCLHYSRRTEEAYLYWSQAFIRFHGLSHPKDMGKPEVEAFLSWLANERQIAASTHKQPLLRDYVNSGVASGGTAGTDQILYDGSQFSYPNCTTGAGATAESVERLWRSVKYDDVYLKAYEGVSDARQSLAAYFEFYNARRPHQSHDGRTPDMVYFDKLPPMKAAA